MKKLTLVMFFLTLAKPSFALKTTVRNLDCNYVSRQLTKPFKGEVEINTEERGPLSITIKPFLLFDLDVPKFTVHADEISAVGKRLITGKAKVFSGGINYYKEITITQNTASLGFKRGEARGFGSTVSCTMNKSFSLAALFSDLERWGSL